jgi:hypothetical protein
MYYFDMFYILPVVVLWIYGMWNKWMNEWMNMKAVSNGVCPTRQILILVLDIHIVGPDYEA